MSGHSKWNNIKRKKEKTDAAKAKVFTKIGREISVIVKTGGANPNENSKLKDAIAKAKAANVPNENIERIIKKAAGGHRIRRLLQEKARRTAVLPRRRILHQSGTSPAGRQLLRGVSADRKRRGYDYRHENLL